MCVNKMTAVILNGLQKIVLFFCVCALQVHAVVLTSGLLECGDVCDIRAAETGHDDGESQPHNYPVIIII